MFVCFYAMAPPKFPGTCEINTRGVCSCSRCDPLQVSCRLSHTLPKLFPLKSPFLSLSFPPFISPSMVTVSLPENPIPSSCKLILRHRIVCTSFCRAEFHLCYVPLCMSCIFGIVGTLLFRSGGGVCPFPMLMVLGIWHTMLLPVHAR